MSLNYLLVLGLGIYVPLLIRDPRVALALLGLGGCAFGMYSLVNSKTFLIQTLLFWHLYGKPRLLSRIDRKTNKVVYSFETLDIFETEPDNIIKGEQEFLKSLWPIRPSLEVGGVALSLVPNGFTCVSGDLDSVENLCYDFNDIKRDANFAKPVKFTDLTNLDVLREQFRLDPLVKLNEGGLIRLRYVAENHPEASPDLWFVVIRESPSKVTIPGGKRLIGETPWECARREFEEEVGHPLPDMGGRRLDPIRVPESKALIFCIDAKEFIDYSQFVFSD